jgi:hypothetical protein
LEGSGAFSINALALFDDEIKAFVVKCCGRLPCSNMEGSERTEIGFRGISFNGDEENGEPVGY